MEGGLDQARAVLAYIPADMNLEGALAGVVAFDAEEDRARPGVTFDACPVACVTVESAAGMDDSCSRRKLSPLSAMLDPFFPENHSAIDLSPDPSSPRIAK